MKTNCLFFIAVLMTCLFQACSTDVDMLAEPKEISAIYGILDYKQDTNFVKINKLICADDPESYLSQHPSVSDFDGKLDVRLIEYVNGVWKREFSLDTITRENKQPGIFSYPKQQLYYTTERLLPNTSERKVSYELVVDTGEQTIVSTTDMVGDDEFRIISPHLNFSKMYFGTVRAMKFVPAMNAGFFDVDIAFEYKERQISSEDTATKVFHVIHSHMNREDLAQSTQDGEFCIRYRPEHFFMSLGEYLGDDTLNHDVWRYITDYPLIIRIDAGGWGMRDYLYLQELQQGTSLPNTDVSCVGHGAVGLFSSRTSITMRGRLAGETVPDLLSMNWGFRFIGGKNEELCENY
ncbi:MAG: hypothetical protein IKM95_04380 [Bacteroidales bacterium]|nr:hypothetical protein [Bacteroidales bacterium]